MTKVTIKYDNETDRVTQTYWGSDDPDWVDDNETDTTVTTTDTTQQKRVDALTAAMGSVEAVTDYDPDKETVVGKLCYDPQTDDLYGEVDIKPI